MHPLQILTAAMIAIAGLPAQSSSLVRDINRSRAPNPSSNPAGFTKLGRYYYFSASTPATGRELFRTLGTPQSLELVKDIHVGPKGSFVSELTVVGSSLFFCADDGSAGAELWKTDGTRAGTVLVRDLAPGGVASAPSGLVAFGSTVLFAADSGSVGRELYKSDGTAAGTVLVRDIYTGPRASSPTALKAIGGWVFCSAETVLGRELWATDGTTAGTRLVIDAFPGAPSSFPQTPTALGSKVYFTAGVDSSRNVLVAIDPASLGTTGVFSWPRTRINNADQPALILGVLGSRLFLSADANRGRDLWTSDGTTTGTTLLLDIALGFGSNPREFTVLGTKALFVADASLIDQQLWITDGTPAGTTNLIRHTAFANLVNLTASGSRVYFSRTANGGQELWASDGTPSGTGLVKDIRAGSRGSAPDDLVPFSANGVLFAADDGVGGREIWTSDGSSQGTRLAVDVNPYAGGTLDSTPALLTDRFGITYFRANDGVHGAELWRSDGTSAGTRLVKDVYPGPDWGYPSQLSFAGGKIYFVARNDVTRRGHLFATDGTAAGTVQLTTTALSPSRAVDYRGVAYFTASDNGATNLYRSDGTANGTTVVYSFPGIGWSPRLTMAAGRMYLVGSDSRGRELWTSDGTSAGTRFVKDLNLGRNGGPYDFTELGSEVVFVALDGVQTAALWKTDGTTAGTVKLLGQVTPLRLTRVGKHVFFGSVHPTAGRGLYRTDGTAAGTVFLKSLDVVSLYYFANLADRLLLFVAKTPGEGQELWKSDGTTQGTVMVKDIRPGPGDGIRSLIFPTGSRWAYFVGNDVAHGAELWRTDGTANGTRILEDVRPGNESGFPRTQIARFALNRGQLLFTADNGTHGFELRRIDPGASVHWISANCGASDPRLHASDPVLGARLELRATRAAVGKIGFLKLGARDGMPISLGSCTSHVDLRLLQIDLGAMLVSRPDWRLAVSVPNDSRLVGLRLTAQAWYVRPAGPPLDLEASNGLELTFGR